jgi:hypothetical protein
MCPATWCWNDDTSACERDTRIGVMHVVVVMKEEAGNFERKTM